MTRKTTIKQMLTVLMQRRDALRQAISGDDSMLKNFTQHSGGDVVDFACDSATGELGSQLAEVENRELQKVELAISKMKDGTYGKCDACGNNIPLARLQALPYAAYCIKCKRAAEQAGVDPNTVVDWAAILSGDYQDNDMDLNLL